MFHLVLYQPEIPPNTGNIIRLCANTGSHLHLVRPLGFRLDDRALARAGMDYRGLAAVAVHENWPDCLEALGERRIFPVSTRAQTPYDVPRYQPGDAFLFGPESRGLPGEILQGTHPDRCIRLPMAPSNRSLNLSNAAAVALYEAWRQNGFGGGT